MLKRQLIVTSALLLSVFLLCGCSNNKETRAAWLATLPSSGIYGSGTDLATALIPDGMAAELPQKLQSLIESTSDAARNAHTYSRYVKVLGDYHGGMITVERSQEDYLRWIDGESTWSDGSDIYDNKYRPGWLLLSTTTWDADKWNINIAQTCQWLEKPDIADFEDKLDFSYASGYFIENSFESFYGYLAEDGYHIEPVTDNQVPATSNILWDYDGNWTSWTEEAAPDRTIHVEWTHMHTSDAGRSEETLFYTAKIRKKLSDNIPENDIWPGHSEYSPKLLYTVRYTIDPTDSVGNFFHTLFKSKNKLSTIRLYMKGEIADDAAYSYNGSSKGYIESDEDMKARNHEIFVFNTFNSILGRDPSADEVDKWMLKFEGIEGYAVAGGDELIVECIDSEEFSSRSLRSIQIVNAIRSAAKLENFGDSSQFQWVKRIDEGLKPVEAAKELVKSDDFVLYCNECDILPSWELTD